MFFPKHQLKRSGIIFITFLGLTSVVLILAVTNLSLLNHATSQIEQEVSRTQARWSAHGGLEIGLEKLRQNASYTGETVNLGGSQLEITLEANQQGLVELHANALNRARREHLVIGTSGSQGNVALPFLYALQAGTSGIVLGTNSLIIGDTYSNQNVTSGNNSVAFGNVSAVGTITKLLVFGQKQTGVPALALPTFDQAFWLAAAQAGTVVNGDLTPADNAEIGPHYIQGNLNLINNTDITINGPVYVTGDIIIGNSVTIHIAEALNKMSTMLISDHKITIGNSLLVDKTSQGGGLLMVAQSSDDDAINNGNGSSIITVPLYAPNGGVIFGNGTWSVATVAKRVQAGNNSRFIYDSSFANATYYTGGGGETSGLVGTLRRQLE